MEMGRWRQYWRLTTIAHSICRLECAALVPRIPCHSYSYFSLSSLPYSYVQASKQNHAAATYRAAVCYELGAGPRKDHARAVQFYRKSAALGNTSGMFKLAMILLHGAMGAPKNEREGVTWLKRAAVAADATNPEALHELALVYERGEVPSVIKDEAHARELYTKASQFGYAPSQYRLGKAYEYAELTCEMDARRSISWYTRAAEQGFPEAELALSCWYLIGAAGILELNETEAYLWARKAAEKGLAKAEYTVGYYSEVGIGTQKDLDEAVRFYTKAAANGNERARTRLADLKKASQMQRRRNNGGGAGAYKGSRDGGDDACNIM